MTVLHMHGDREHESIKAIDSLTQPSEHACFDLAKHYSSYNVPYRVYIPHVDRDCSLCAKIPRVPVNRDLAHRPELVGVIRTPRTCRSR